MADGHQRRADDDRARAPQPTIGDRPSQNWREINEAGVEPVDLRGECLRAERTEIVSSPCFKASKAERRVHARRRQQIVDHVEDEKRPHPVIGKPLPHFGSEEKTEPTRMAEKIVASLHSPCRTIVAPACGPRGCYRRWLDRLKRRRRRGLPRRASLVRGIHRRSPPAIRPGKRAAREPRASAGRSRIVSTPRRVPVPSWPARM